MEAVQDHQLICRAKTVWGRCSDVQGVAQGAFSPASVPNVYGREHRACIPPPESANKPVKLLDTTKTATCPSGWKAVTWNQKGQPGTPSAAGTPGAPGTPGAAGVSGYTTVSAFAKGCGNCTGLTAEADCPIGKVPLGGGFTTPVGVPHGGQHEQDAPYRCCDGSNNVVGEDGLSTHRDRRGVGT